MAQRRMFNKSVTDSDMFIEMASSAQALYFHLNQGADDDGFNNQVQNAMFKAHAGMDDLKVLLAKNFLMRFENGVIVIKHWRLHNTLRKDRYTPTDFQAELNCLGLAKNGEYVIENNGRLPSGCQVVAKWLPQDRIGKDNISHESRACACEKNDENVAFNDFLSAHPTIKNDLNGKIVFEIDWDALGKAIRESEWLKNCTSLKWLIENYDKVIDGAYKTFKADKAGHFAGEREYTPGELNSLLKNVDDIDF